MEMFEKAAHYCHSTLKRQLEHNAYHPMEWAINAATLSQFYINKVSVPKWFSDGLDRHEDRASSALKQVAAILLFKTWCRMQLAALAKQYWSALFHKYFWIFKKKSFYLFENFMAYILILMFPLPLPLSL